MSTILKTRTINDGALSVGFIPSANVKVFPCAYRGYINDNGISVGIDPESKANTEYNYVNMYSKLGTTKPSYVISNISNTLKCIIGGYYFEITGLSQEDFIETITDANSNVSYSKKYLVLNTKPISMPVSETDSSRNTKVLKSLIDENVDYLDTKIDNTYYFVGLAVANTTIGFEASLAPFTVDEAAPQNWESKTIYDVLDTGAGAYSLRNLCSNASEDNEAHNKYSIALGEGSKAYNDYQIVLGKYNNHIESTSTDDDGNTVYNYYDDIVIVGNGNSTNRSNSFRLSKEGNINTIGSITAAKKLTIGSEGAEITGNVDLKGNTTIGTSSTKANLNVNGDATIIGTTSITGNTSVTSGTLDVAKKLTVNSEGAEITGNVEIKSGTLKSAQKLTVESGGAEISGNSTIDGTVGITGNTSVAGTLSVTSTVTSGGKLTVSTGGADITGNTKIISGTLTSAKKLKVEAEGAEISGGIDITSGGANIIGDTEIDGNFTSTEDITTETGIIKFNSAGSKVISYNSTNAQFEINDQLEVKGKVFAEDFQATGESTVTSIKASDNIETDKAVIATGDVEGANIKTDGAVTAGSISTTGAVATGSLTTTGNASVTGTSTVGKLITGTDGAEIKGATTITGAATISGKTTIGTTSDALNLEVTGKAKISGTLELPFNGTGLIVGKSATIGNMSINTTISGSGETETKSTSISGINSISAAGNISTAGNITTTNGNIKTESGYVEGQYFNATSDRRLKQNIEDYKCEKSILELPIKKYEFINSPGKIHIGCIAQDLQKICPEIVSEDEKGYLSIQENKLIYLLLQEIKELKARIEKLENK